MPLYYIVVEFGLLIEDDKKGNKTSRDEEGSLRGSSEWDRMRG